MGKTIKTMKANKREVLIAFIAGIILLFAVNNLTSQPAYDLISCTYNTFGCDGAGSDGGGSSSAWDGNCTAEIEDECCDYASIDYCGGQIVQNPAECYHYYCTGESSFCGAEYDQDEGGRYICGCKDIEDINVV